MYGTVKNLLENICKISPSKAESVVQGPEIESFADILKAQPVGFMERWGRKAVYETGKFLPEKGYKGVLGKIKNFSGRKNSPLILPSEGKVNKFIVKKFEEYGFKESLWQGNKYSVVFTYDVDTKEGYNYLTELININNKFNIKGTFNFLTGFSYDLKQELVENLKKTGNEIGLHGVDHNISIGYRNNDYISKNIDSAVQDFQERGIEYNGYRAPALSVSENLLKNLNRKDFLYDSSLQVCAPFYHSVECNFPYLYPELNLWEFPIAIQDDTLFNDYLMDEEKAYHTLKTIIEDIKNIRGMAVLIFHPGIVKNHVEFYKKFVEYISKDDEALITTPESIINSLVASRKA